MQRHAAAEAPTGTLLQVGDARSRVAQAGGAIAAPLAVITAAVGWWAIRGIDHRFISFSDGVYMYAAAEAAAHGVQTLYNDVALSLPPGTLLGTAILWKLSPHVETVRLGLAALSLLTALLSYSVARALFGLRPWWAALAAGVALTGPVYAQFVGLEGEAVLTPLLLALALAIERRRRLSAAILLGLGFLFKLTWAPFFVAGVIALALREGRRVAVWTGAAGALLAVGLFASVVQAFGWSARDLFTQLVLAQSRSSLQLRLMPGLVATVLLLWWPGLALARRAFGTTGRTALVLGAAGAFSSLYMLKQGTFFNVVAPLEPLLAIAAVAGAVNAWRCGRPRDHILVIVCAIAGALHVASVTGGTLTRALPLPVGAALVNVDNERSVDHLASAIAARSTPDQPVLVNPLLALVAERREAGGAADWFILRALQRYCGSDLGRARHCGAWTHAKELVRRGAVSVVSVDSNVLRFDPTFERDTNVAALTRVADVNAPPLESSLYAR
jgi:hypothetical protein